MPQLSRILLYPIKSLDGVAVTEAVLLKGGALQGDLEFAIIDQKGRIINGKRDAKIHRVRSQFDLCKRLIHLNVQGESTAASFHLDQQRSALEVWLSDFFGQPVALIQNLETGFPEDLDSTGPTIVSEATLKTVASWYPSLDFKTIRCRFRTNLELDAAKPFWEDRLFSEPDCPIPFQIGAVAFRGTNPCQRCPVPTRNPETGEAYEGFQKTFVAKRRETLPDGVIRSRFNHFYRLTVNTRVPASEAGKVLRIGDSLHISSHPGAA
ncbi:MAG: MOSC N-terminal beta barrel domain-containing protein [Thermosynechococcaceae cyanobacterium]